jgi:hypothetical protein
MLPEAQCLEHRIKLDPYRPAQIYREVCDFAKHLPPGQFHLDYTGGTKAMGVNSQRALADVLAAKSDASQVTSSYLGTGDHTLMNQDDQPIDNIGDERKQWRHALSLVDLLELHGYTTKFAYKYKEKTKKSTSKYHLLSFGSTTPGEINRFPNTGEMPSVEVRNIATDMLTVLSEWQAGPKYSLWIKEFWDEESGKYKPGKWPFKPSLEIAPLAPIRWPSLNDVLRKPRNVHLWESIPSSYNKSNEIECWDKNKVFTPEGCATTESLANAINFFRDRGYFEIAVAHALNKSLIKRRLPFNIYHSVYISKIPFNDDPVTTPPSELDVVAILGYQLLYISCTTDPRDKVKQKAFEALHRARQVGGDAAMAVLLSNATEEECTKVEDDLFEETGLQRKRLQIWGSDAVRNIDYSFESLLNKLHWN